MSKATLKFEASAFSRVKEIVANEYNRITVKSSGKVSATKTTGESPKIIIKPSTK
ncbi:hypothetical protein [Sphingobacterium cellulitidis]|uniref:hypothetical protein n=1 Tax=Sphingobacterium cellulitidis TaxID=1768011 RepID=UPI0015C5A78E|nr:hypothetical protein [Sphingobacterium cellulitidis]